MSTLHLVSSTAALASCLEVAQAADHVLLIEDGVYAATTANAGTRVMSAVIDDLELRGLQQVSVEPINAIDYDAFVDLCVTHQPIVTWA